MTDKKTVVASTSILASVDYERIIKYELKTADGRPTRVIFSLNSNHSKAVKDATRANFAELAVSSGIDANDKVEQFRRAESVAERGVANAIADIDVPADVEFITGVLGKPELTDALKLEIARIPWVFDQLNRQINNVKNFMNP